MPYEDGRCHEKSDIGTSEDDRLKMIDVALDGRATSITMESLDRYGLHHSIGVSTTTVTVRL